MQDLVVTPWPLTIPVALVATVWAWRARTSHQVPAPRGADVAARAGGGRTSRCARSDHWLQGWLADVGDHAPLPAEHVKQFHQSSDVVFAALVQILATEAQIELIEGFGTVVVFTPGHGAAGGQRPMRAGVRRCGGYTVLEISSDQPPAADLVARQRECAQVHELLCLLSHRLQGTTRVGRGIRSSRPHEVLSA